MPMNGHRSNSGVSLNHTRWDSAAIQIHQHVRRVCNRIVSGGANPQMGVTLDQVTQMDWHEGVETQTANPGEDPAMPEIGHGLDHKPPGEPCLMTNVHQSDMGGDTHLPCHHQAHWMIGTPSLQYWMMWVGDGRRKGNTSETPERNMSGNSSGGFRRESKRWLDSKSNMRQHTKGSRTSSQLSNILARTTMEYL